MATIQAAKCYGLKHLGAIAPGYQADMVIFDNLQDFKVLGVYHKGTLVEQVETIFGSCKRELKATMHLDRFSKEILKVKRPAGLCHVIKMEAGQIITKDLLRILPGETEFEANQEYNKIAAIERHKNTGKAGVGVVTGFHLSGGAVASSVSHDSHNIIVIGDNDEDMELAVNELIRTQGGYTIAEHGKIFETLPLPVMGLMSDAGFDKVDHTLKKMIAKAHDMGVPEDMDPFITLSFMALPVIPELRITPRGLFHVGEFRLTGLEAE